MEHCGGRRGPGGALCAAACHTVAPTLVLKPPGASGAFVLFILAALSLCSIKHISRPRSWVCPLQVASFFMSLPYFQVLVSEWGSLTLWALAMLS